MAILFAMATPTIKSTYVAVVEQPPSQPKDALRALDNLQRSLKLTPVRARDWARQSLTERRATSVRSETRGA